MQRGRSVVVTEQGVRPGVEEQVDHVHVTAVGGAVERRGPAWRPGRRTSAAPEQEGAHVAVAAAAGVVLERSITRGLRD